ncbi:OmpA family protein [Halomonas sp. TBZ9]|uniref:OmpA family protein n=1 Tax=Vreelandella azerica TaxID=2732867 RepID=A0A7Y3TY07_9GAMM|nr:OmpA family protein [Halomonas azerica]NOG32058.1 OmpA family protein [Halomonas azerica]
MKKSTTGLLIGSALVVGLSGCASSASQSASSASMSSDGGSGMHPFVCGLAGSVIGGAIGYSTSGNSDEDENTLVGATAGAAIGGLLCADRTVKAEPQCPSYGAVPAGAAVDAEGCPLDSDGDGIPDYRDQCPGTPAGVSVNANGCPVDSDNDGVPDYRDQCPGTPAGVAVNSLGCPDALVLEGVNFEFDSARLTTDAQQILRVVAERLVNNPNVRVSIEGHTDSRGSADYNKRLSQSRAESVAAYLNQLGVSADRMMATGYGEERPVASNDTAAGRAENRRVELDEWN